MGNLLESLGPQVLNEHKSSCGAIGNVLCNVIDLFLIQSKFLIIGSLRQQHLPRLWHPLRQLHQNQ